jgi:hypothetical protein
MKPTAASKIVSATLNFGIFKIQNYVELPGTRSTWRLGYRTKNFGRETRVKYQKILVQ